MKAKSLFLFIALFVSSCATSKKMMLPSGEQGHSIRCDGTAMSWEHCFEKAAEVCPKGYKRFDQNQMSGVQQNFYNGTMYGTAQRNMLIQCKK
jgi:hypothetical protein